MTVSTSQDHQEQLVPPQHAKDIARLQQLAHRMDTAFRVPVLGVRLGWDAILGVIPGIGDALALAPSVYILKEAHRLGAPTPLLLRMGANTGIDLALGAVPVIGDLFDVAWKSKTANVALLTAHLAKDHAPSET